MRPLRAEMQMVFQDPFASLNPRKRVGQIIGAPLELHGRRRSEIAERTRALLERVGLNREHINRFPHEFSGGQRQRVGVARALALEPKLILLDEPVSALDVSIQAQIVNLLDDLQDEFNLTYVFVAHDLSVVRHVSDRIAVMYLGKIMELSPSEELYAKPIHPYTSALLAAIPIPDPRENRRRERIVVTGEPPSPVDPPSGCVFHTRCPRAQDLCRQEVPRLSEYPNGHLAACHFPLNVTREEVAASTKSPLSPLSSGDTQPTVVDAGARPPSVAALRDKTLFISGASRGIGLAIALRAARDGANVALIAKTAEPHPKLEGTVYTAAEQIEEAGGKALPIVGDIRDEAQVDSAVAQAVERFGGIDVCVNNASAINLARPEELELKRYDLMQDINVRGTFAVIARVHAAPAQGRRTRTSSPSARRSASSRAGSRRTSATRSPSTA